MSSTSPPRIFDRALLRQRRNRAAGSLTDYNFLVERAIGDLLDRLEPIVRDFPLALALGGAGLVGRARASNPALSAKIGALIESDLSPRISSTMSGLKLAMDEEALSIRDESVDLVLAPLGLHWANDLPGTLIQINRALKPDGFFAAALIGGASLTELRQSLMAAEVEITGGVSARVSPFADAQDMSQLLQRAGFALPVADVDRMTVRYDNAFALMHDLRGMGETSVLAERPRTPGTKALFLRAAEIYAERFSDPDGRIRATFEIVHAAGWAPHPDQPRPKRPGSATVRLADALGTREMSAGEKAGG